jgi:hypothetical protein
VTNLENELDSFKAPKFLNMSDVRALVWLDNSPC